MRYVSWHEALAYCEWLNEIFATSGELTGTAIARRVREQGWRVTLPSELEWEKAARGGLVNKVFPWGDTPDPNRANYDDSGINDTSAVGCFPANEYGLLDMIGNVWEWTRSHYVSYPDRADDGRENLEAADDVLRVVRGGSWCYHPGYARCACRYWVRPVDRSYDIGFRVVLRSPLVP